MGGSDKHLQPLKTLPLPNYEEILTGQLSMAELWIIRDNGVLFFLFFLQSKILFPQQ